MNFKLKDILPQLITVVAVVLVFGFFANNASINMENRGITAISVIETSHIAMHVWDEPQPALMQLDIYSCAEFNPYLIDLKVQCEYKIIYNIYFYVLLHSTLSYKLEIRNDKVEEPYF